MWAAAVMAPPCDFSVFGRPLEAALEQTERAALAQPRFNLRRQYPGLWATCVLDRGAAPPMVTVRAQDSGGSWVVMQKSPRLSASLDPDSVGQIFETFAPCPEPSGTRRQDAVLHGPAGLERWHHPTKVTVEITGRGPAEAIHYRTSAEVLCPVCPDGRAASTSFYRMTGRGRGMDNKLRFIAEVDPKRLACAQGAGALHLRYFWGEPSADPFQPLEPFATVEHLERKLVLKERGAQVEMIHEPKPFCRNGRRFIWELVGTGEFAFLANSPSHGPSRFLRRGGVEFQRCP